MIADPRDISHGDGPHPALPRERGREMASVSS
jgi:hypothetical protein